MSIQKQENDFENMQYGLLISAVYDNQKRAAVLKFYEPTSEKIFLWIPVKHTLCEPAHSAQKESDEVKSEQAEVKSPKSEPSESLDITGTIRKVFRPYIYKT